MSKAKVGSGELTPFKKGSTGSESIGGSTNKEHEGRENLTHHVFIDKASRNVTELTPFKTGPTGPGVNTGNPTVPKFRERDGCGIPMEGYKPFSDKEL
jgi:hypothetical protein